MRAQYDRYKKRLGDDAPKSFYAFKRLKNAGGDKWTELQEKYRASGVDKHREIDDNNSNFNKDVIKSKFFNGNAQNFKISNNAINSIKPLKINGYTPEENEKLSDYCKEMLKYMKDSGVEAEGVIKLNLNFEEVERYKARTENGRVKITSSDVDCIIIHNHPDGLIFSELDYEVFLQHQEIKGLVAVGNNGNVFFIRKTVDFPQYEMEYAFYSYNLRKKYPKKMTAQQHIDFSEKIFEEMTKYGIETYAATVE